MSLKDLLTTLIIYSPKGIDVSVFDVPGAYLNAEIPEYKFILINIEGGYVYIMCEVNHERKKNVRV